MINSLSSGTLIKTILYTSEIDEEKIKEQMNQKIADSIKYRFPGDE